MAEATASAAGRLRLVKKQDNNKVFNEPVSFHLAMILGNGCVLQQKSGD